MEQNTLTGQQAAPQISSKLQSTILIVVFVLFVLFIFFGILSGLSFARSKATYANVQIINQGLTYFYSDQDHYPTADQYYNGRILATYNYMSDVPRPEDANGACKSYPDFVYSQSGPKHFALQFCLTQGVAGLSSGVHTLTDKGLQ